MVKARRDDKTMDLLAWTPEPVEITYDDPRSVQAPSLSSRFARAISKALNECGKTRKQVAKEMGDYLGEDFSKNMLNAYASEARENHIINLHRFAALIHATGDEKLLTLLPNEFGFAVVDREYMPLCERVIRRTQLKRKRAEIEKQIGIENCAIEGMET